MSFLKKNNIVAIGDTVSDIFITLDYAQITCEENLDCKISIPWGQKIPYKNKVQIDGVGNSANASVGISRLGIGVSLLTWLGEDKIGEDCIKVLKNENIDTSLIQQQKNKETNLHFAISYEAERTILVKHENFDYSISNIPKFTKWIYFSSLGEGAISIHDTLYEKLKENKDIKLLFQPGTFQMKAGYKRLKNLYERTNIYVLNKDEARLVLETKETDEKKLLDALQKLGPETVVVTDGPNGVYALNDSKYYYVPMYPDPKPPLERTGAGDAFTSTLFSYLYLGYSFKEALLRAPINSMNVVQHYGAQEGLMTNKEIENWLQKAPKHYKVTDF